MNTPDKNLHNVENDPRRAGIVRTALLLGGVALTFYLGFIAIGVLRSLA